MDQEDIFFCNSPECDYPIKIISSFAEQKNHHNGHELSSISDLRKELQQQDNEFNPLKQDSPDDKQDLLDYIDNEVEELRRSFSITLGKLGSYLKQFVNENLTSLKRIQMLFKAVVENNIQQINLHQDHLEFLKKDNEFFQDQKDVLDQVRDQIYWTINSTSNQIAALDRLNLTRPILMKHAWSITNKHNDINLEGKFAQNTSESGYNAVLIENLLSFQKTQKFKLRIVAMSHYIMLQICDLRTIKAKCPNFENIDQDGFGAYSHFNNGSIYGTDTYGHGTTNSFTFAIGDILELQWNGPLKQFTTLKVETGEKFVFDVKFDESAELYFAVTFYNACTVELL